MVEANKTPSRYWWFDSHNNSPRRSQWLQSTLAELDEKTSSMLQIIEEDADSFAQRAEMYYKKRPELINMVQDFYRAHRSLAERYDQVKSDSATRPTRQWTSPVSFKYQTEMKLMISPDKSYDSYSETYDPEESGESEVDDPEQEEKLQVDKEIEEEEVSSGLGNDEAMKLREEIERLKEENGIQKEQLTQKDEEKREIIRQQLGNDEATKLREEIERLKEENGIQKEQLMQKDEEKREVIRQLSSTVDMLKEENVKLRKYIANSPKKWSPPEFNKLKAVFLGKLFNASPKSRASVAL